MWHLGGIVSAWLNELYGVWGWPGWLAGPGILLWLSIVVLWARIYRLRPAAGTWLIASVQFPTGIWLWNGVFGVPESPLKFYVTVFFTVIPGWLLYRSTQRDNRRNQDMRDAAADRIAQSPGARFALYLRSFGTTETLSTQPYIFDRNDYGDPPVHLDLEQVLRVALGGTLPLLAAGQPDDLRGGAGRLVLPHTGGSPLSRISRAGRNSFW
jgi:hypothetical protein